MECESQQLVDDYLKDRIAFETSLQHPYTIQGHVEVLVSTDPEDDDTEDGYHADAP